MSNDKLLGMLGLAARARKIITGTELVTEKIKSGKKVELVLIAADVSQNTFKKLVIFRLITPISMKIMDENDRKSIDDLIRLIYISDYNTILKNICNYYKNGF